MGEIVIGTAVFSLTEEGVISSWPENGNRFFCRIIRPDGETWVGSESRDRRSPGMVVWIPRLLGGGEGIIITELKSNCAIGEIIAPRKTRVRKCKEKDCGGNICEEGLFKSVGDGLQIKMYPCRKCGKAHSRSGKAIHGKGGTKVFLKNGDVVCK